jgi:hypothetical protein
LNFGKKNLELRFDQTSAINQAVPNIPHNVLLMFAAARLGEIIPNVRISDPEYVLGRLMLAQFLINPLDHLCVSESGDPFRCLEEAANDFTVSVIFDPNHAGLADGGVLHEPLFDFSWEDVFTTYREQSMDEL